MNMQVYDRFGWPFRVADKWSVITETIEDLYKPRNGEQNQFVFRGQEDASWGLEPTLLRRVRERLGGKITDCNLARNTALKMESCILKEFSSRSHLLPQWEAEVIKSQPSNSPSLQSWAICRHYGAPTRLLDWSLSPYVAMYFAVNDKMNEDGALWIVDPLATNDRRKDQKLPDQYPGEWTSASNRGSWLRIFDGETELAHFSRAKAQNGTLGICNDVLADHADVLKKYFEGRDNPFYWWGKLIIPAAKKPEYLRRLRSMNIGGAALYPDIYGVGKSADDIAKAFPLPGDAYVFREYL